MALTHYPDTEDGQESYYHLLQLFSHPLLYQMAEKLRRIQILYDDFDPLTALHCPRKIEEDLQKIERFVDMFRRHLRAKEELHAPEETA